VVPDVRLAPHRFGVVARALARGADLGPPRERAGSGLCCLLLNVMAPVGGAPR
jgi:hypothetical protein